MLPDSIKPCLQGIVPSWIVTSDGSGIPNAAVISQVFYVDKDHIAISNQFFGKTVRNLDRNPFAQIQVLNPADFGVWLIDVEFLRREAEGALFDQMDMQLQAIASMIGAQDLFKLRSADVCRVISVYESKESQRAT